MPLQDKLTIEKKPLKTAAALRAGDTEHLRRPSPPIMDEQDEIESLKAQIRAQSEASLRLKRAAANYLKWMGYAHGPNSFPEEREALRKVLDETP